MEAAMFATLVAVICAGQLCSEEIVTDTNLSGMTFVVCQMQAQATLAQWIAEHPNKDLRSYKCVQGHYSPKGRA